MKAKALQICGTASNVGKSVMVSALGRIFLQDGYKVCPFKAQNMALNSSVTKEWGEIGRAQAAQAQACGIEPSVDMNPILIKPTSNTGAQIIVGGKPIGAMNAQKYEGYKKKLFPKVKESFKKLSAAYEVVVIEGAGSPAEINLKKNDIVNMNMAKYARAPVILVGDIDRGGVFAHIVGTLDLLTPKERKMVKGIIINKFRGDKKLLKGGIDFIERRTGIRVLGIIPYFNDINIAQEDSVVLEKETKEEKRKGLLINIAVIQLPHISNFTDFEPLEKEPDVALHYVTSTEQLNSPDLVIIPGTKNTISDLGYLNNSNIAARIMNIMRTKPKAVLLGICGGYQILGKSIYDFYALESRQRKINGLGMLPIETHLKKEKVLTQVSAEDMFFGCKISGYEIHHGQTKTIMSGKPFFRIIERCGHKVNMSDGTVSADKRVWGTYIHGIFDNDNFRRRYLNHLRRQKGWKPLGQTVKFNQEDEFDKLAWLVRKNIDMNLLYKIVFKL